MKLVFLSNYLTVHQVPFYEYMYQKFGCDFIFVATTPISSERLRNGYTDLNSSYPFVIRAYEGEEEKQKAKQLTDVADVVVIGSAPLDFVKSRLKEKKLTFLYSERLYKPGYEAWKWPVRMWTFWNRYGRHSSLYLLSASAYTAGDFAKTGTFLNKAYKWGYFPPTCRYNIDELIDKKMPGSLLWVGRFLDWKHPEYAVEIARRLKAENYDFKLRMIGNGETWEEIAKMIQDMDLQEQVELIGAVPAEEVRKYMEAASVFLFTSDRNEGWGAVLNESMNSACAVLASNIIGSVPFLLEDGRNGLIYKSGNVDELYKKVKFLLDNEAACKLLGENAYETITELWCAEEAAERLLKLVEAILQGEKIPHIYEHGPCSKAKILRG